MTFSTRERDVAFEEWLDEDDNRARWDAAMRSAQERADATCPRCHGDGEIPVNPGYPDPQTEDSACCPECGGTGEQEAGRPRV